MVSMAPVYEYPHDEPPRRSRGKAVLTLVVGVLLGWALFSSALWVGRMTHPAPPPPHPPVQLGPVFTPEQVAAARKEACHTQLGAGVLMFEQRQVALVNPNDRDALAREQAGINAGVAFIRQHVFPALQADLRALIADYTAAQTDISETDAALVYTAADEGLDHNLRDVLLEDAQKRSDEAHERANKTNDQIGALCKGSW